MLAVDFAGRFFGRTADLDPLGQRLLLLDTRHTLDSTLGQLGTFLLRLTGSFMRLVGDSILGGGGTWRLFTPGWLIAALWLFHFPINKEEVLY